MTERVIFLDMDGVLVTLRRFHAQKAKGLPSFGANGIDPECVANLNALVAASEAKIVVSSTWRLNRTRASFSDIFEAVGVTAALHPDWRTVRLDGYHKYHRGDEVLEWLSGHPEATAYVALDDDNDFHPDQNLVLTEFESGLTAGHVVEALRFFEVAAGRRRG